MGVTAPRIVVGVDDSPQSIAALAWAMGQAEATGASIEAVYAFQVPLPIPYSRVICVPAGPSEWPGWITSARDVGHPPEHPEGLAKRVVQLLRRMHAPRGLAYEVLFGWGSSCSDHGCGC